MTSVYILIAAGLITAVGVVTTVKAVRNYNATVAWYETIERRRKLKEYQKRRMCNSFCKFKESAETEEELEWKCANCPIAEL